MIRSIRNVARLLGLARALARHDALFGLEKIRVAGAVAAVARLGQSRDAEGRPGERLARALHEAGPSFIKLGQALSTRSDILGEEMAADLTLLQDRLPPFSGERARTAIAEEFGAPLDSLFAEFDDQAVAAASIAQAHFAVTADGREVAVKVLRPGIEAAFARDLDLFFWVAGLIERRRPEWRRMKPVESVAILAETVKMEMDLRFEAAAASELADNFDGDDTFRVPRVDWTLTGRRVMTMERVVGIPLDDRKAVIAAGLDPLAVLEKATAAFFRQVFRDGFFHADLHSGNLFVGADGNIVAVDFGIMGRLDRRARRHLGDMLLAFLNRDYRRAAEVHFEAGWVPQDQSVDAFAQACRSIAEPILDRPQNEISMARLLGQLFQVTETFRMETQPSLLLLQKTMLEAEGTARSLCPEANMWMLSRPLIEDWMNEGTEERIREVIDDVAATVRHLPRLMDGVEKSAAMLAGGRLKLHPETVRELKTGSNSRVNLPALAAVILLLGALASLLM